MRALVVTLAIVFARPVLAQPAEAPSACFPECRAGFTCRASVCVAPEPARPADEPAVTGVVWGPASNAPGTGTQTLAADAAPAPAPPRKPSRFEVGLTFGLDSVFLSTRSPTDFTAQEVAMLEPGTHAFRMNVSAPVELKIREGTANMFFAARIGWGLLEVLEKYDTGFVGLDSEAGILVAAQQVFRVPLSRGEAPLLDDPMSIDLGVGGFFASQGTLGGMANVTLNVYWLGIGPQVSYGTETELDVGIRFTSRVAF